jgi:hypothetical protein
VRIGCLGCLSWLVLAAVALGLAAGGYWLVSGTLLEPPQVSGSAPGSPRQAELALERAFRAQVAARGLGGSGRRHPVTVALGEADVAAVLAKHLPSASEMPLAVRSLALTAERFELVVQLPARALVAPWFPRVLMALLPGPWRDRPVWVRLQGAVRVESGAMSRRPYLRTEPTGFWLGRRRLPTGVLRLVLSPASLGLLQWPLPPQVEDVRLEPGRLLVRVGPPR